MSFKQNNPENLEQFHQHSHVRILPSPTQTEEIPFDWAAEEGFFKDRMPYDWASEPRTEHTLESIDAMVISTASRFSTKQLLSS